MSSTRATGVTSIDQVVALQEKNIPFQCRYDFHDLSGSNAPRYTCTYILPGKKESALISTRIGMGGAKKRLFVLWPGLFRHHWQYGDGSHIVVHEDNRISTIKIDVRGQIVPQTGPLAEADVT